MCPQLRSLKKYVWVETGKQLLVERKLSLRFFLDTQKDLASKEMDIARIITQD